MKTSLSCDLKGQQKLFIFFLNQTSSCCRAYPETLDPSKSLNNYIEHWQNESRALDQGIEIASCEHCWKRERNGEISLRSDQERSNWGEIIELAFSNACNQMCSYCSPKFSSTWQDSVSKHGVFENISQNAKNNLQIPKISDTRTEHWMNQIDDYIQHRPDNSVTLKLIGGEPLMQIANLQKLLRSRCDKIKKIEITTNLNPPNNKFLLWLLQNVDTEKIKMTVSLDACPDYNHVPRAGFDQKKFQDNLKLLINHKVNFEFLAVMSVLGIFDIANYIKWANKNNFKVVFNSINNPDCLDPKYIPQQFLQPITKQFGDHIPPMLFSDLLKIEQPEVGLKLFEQYNYLTQYFSRTDINPKKINNQFFQDYWNWLTNKVKK